MAWLTPIDRKRPHPLDAWNRLDGALRRAPHFQMIVMLVVMDYAFRNGRWMLFGLLTLLLIGVALEEFVPRRTKDEERSL